MEDNKTNLPGVTTWEYFIGIDEFGDLECFQRAANLSYDEENSPLVRANGIPIVGNTTQASLKELDQYGTLSFKTKEERNESYEYLTFSDKRFIKIDPKGIYNSHHKCPECGETMTYTLGGSLDNVVDSTSSYEIRYLCSNNHKHRMSLNDAIEKFGKKL
jgi:hypothetical protein